MNQVPIYLLSYMDGTSMACLEEQDLSNLAKNHITAQKANIQNQRQRLSEIQDELKTLKSGGSADELRILEAEDAIADLDYHLDGRVKRSTLEEEVASLKKNGLRPERLKKIEQVLASSKDDLLKDPDLKTAEQRAKVMEALYTQRSQLVFQDSAHDKDKDGNPITRYCSVFGVPTVKKMLEVGEKEIAEDLMLRSVSMVMSGNQARNPADYLDTTGIEVKKALSDGIEHHHIYNNVYVDNDGRVAPNSVRFFVNPRTKNLEMQVIPEYWNSTKHGRSTQFIELMDAAHSGDDTATHLHYYRFTDKESEPIKEKIKEKISEINSTNQAKVPKLKAELDSLNERKQNPKEYERKLLDEVAGYERSISNWGTVEAKYTTVDKAGRVRKNKDLTEAEERELQTARDRRKELQKTRDKTQKSLEEHQNFMNLESNLKRWGDEVSSLEAQAKAIKLNVKFPAFGFATKEEATAFKEGLRGKFRMLRLEIDKNKKVLREKGSIDQQIRDKSAKLEEAERLANLTEMQALELYDRTNGYFHFDKGHQESEDYSKSRPKMNAEIHKYNVRQTIEALEGSGKDIIETLQEMARKHYRRNLLYNLEPLIEKVAGTLG